MKSSLVKLILAVLVLFVFAPAAFAGLLGPFSFSFFNSALNTWFLFPFRLGGCF